eukprot:11497506-Alexandrium_andersonii.AAC.1
MDVAPEAAPERARGFVDLSLQEVDLVKNGLHVLVTFIIKPAAGRDYLGTAACLAAVASAGMGLGGCAPGGSCEAAGAL